jgi:hypothetical protein
MLGGTGIVSARGAVAANGLAVTARSRVVLMWTGELPWRHGADCRARAASESPLCQPGSVVDTMDSPAMGPGRCARSSCRERCSHIIAIGGPRHRWLALKVRLAWRSLISAPVWGIEGLKEVSD